MKKACASVLLGLALTLAATAAGPWTSDFPAAKAEAAKTGRLLLLDFTGSDWCSFCVRMKKDTLDQTEFLDYAKTNLVLVEVDFPRRKRLSPEQTRANEELQRKHRVQVFPTYVVLDADGKELGRKEGYVQGGPKAFISVLEGLKKKAG